MMTKPTKTLIAGVLIAVGGINLYALLGVLSAEQLQSLFGVALNDPNLLILLRHRAVLFGLLGSFIAISAFKREWQLTACVAGLVSMLSFAALAYSVGDFGDSLRKVVVADIVASIGLVVVLVLRARRQAEFHYIL